MYSYSKVTCFWDCPFKYKIVYRDKLKAKFNEKPDNALVLGTALHESIETMDIDKALDDYYKNYKDLCDANKIEAYKVRKVAEKAIKELPRGQYEMKLVDEDFIGFIDLVVKVEEGLYDIYDFKYSNNVSGYLESPQIHLYKYYFEKITGNRVRNISYVFLPKVSIKEAHLEDSYKLVDEALDKAKIRIETVDYDPRKVSYYFARKASLVKAEKNEEYAYEKRNTWKCKWCDFRKYCLSDGEDRSELDE